MSSLKNKIAVVTGGNSGIGYAAAKELIEGGAQVVITGRNIQATVKAAEELGAIPVVADQTNLGDIDRLVDEVSKKFGKIDILFLNAGAAGFGSIENLSEEVYDQVMNGNVKGTLFTVQKFIPYLNEGASIIFTGSVNAVLGMPDSGVYAASKAALTSLNRVLAKELASRKIRTNIISPGPIETPLYGKLGMSEEQVNGFAQELNKHILLNRFGSAAEIGKIVKFLASDDSSFITGTEITADGGLTVNAVIY